MAKFRNGMIMETRQEMCCEMCTFLEILIERYGTDNIN